MSVPWDLSEAVIEDLKHDLLSKITNSEWAEETYKYVFSWFKCIQYKSLFLDNCDKSKDRHGYKEIKYFSTDFILHLNVNLLPLKCILPFDFYLQIEFSNWVQILVEF